MAGKTELIQPYFSVPEYVRKDRVGHADEVVDKPFRKTDAKRRRRAEVKVKKEKKLR